MEIIVTARNLGITDRFRDYAEERAQKVAHLAERAFTLEIKVTRHHETHGTNGDDRVELTLIGPGPLVRAEAAASDKYSAFDQALDKLVERIRKAKDRKKVHRGQHRPVSLREASADGFRVVDVTPVSADVMERVSTGATGVSASPLVDVAEVDEPEWSPVVIRTKVFASTPMTVEDALYYMELVGHDFYLFIDRDTRRPSVVYRRKGWDYGVIGLDDSAEERQEEAIESLRISR